MPLLHPAHVLSPGDVRAGAGLSGQIALLAPPTSSMPTPAAMRSASLGDVSVAPALAPWVSARVGIPGENEGGLAYAGRAIRLDGRHAFSFDDLTLSLGLGASGVIPKGSGQGDSGVYGGGIDIPVLFGLKSTSDLYSVWFGPRAGLDLLRGQLPGKNGGSGPEDMSARHVFAGFVAGVRAGFRRVHVALELDGSYHRVDGSIGGVVTSRTELTLTPGGALLISF